MHAARRSLFILSYRFPLVKNFFRVFSNFFKSSHPYGSDPIFNQAVEPGRRSRKRLAYYITGVSVCQALFSDFSNLFQVVTSRNPYCMPLSQALGYSSKANQKSQPLFSIFPEFFRIFLSRHKMSYHPSYIIQDTLMILPLSP